MNKPIRLDSGKIREAFENAQRQVDYITAIYTMVFPDLDKIEKIGDDTLSWPKCSHQFWRYILGLAMEADKRIARETGQMRCGEPTFMPGGMWMNNGFTTDDTLEGDVVIPCGVTYRQAEAKESAA